MALSERSRVLLHTKLTEVVGDEEAVSDMLSEFPANDRERPATKEFVAATAAELRTEIADLGSSLRTEMADLGSSLHGEIADLRTELQTDLIERFGAVDVRISQMETRLVASFHDDMITHLKWFMGMMGTFNIFIATMVALAV